MGSWDELCILCGACPEGGPHDLLHPEGIDDYARQLADEIDPYNDDLFDTIRNALKYSIPQKTLLFRAEWLPNGMGSRQYCSDVCVALGYFGKDEGTVPRDRDGIPDGRNVQVRRVTDSSSGDFERVLQETVVQNEDVSAGDESAEEDEVSGEESFEASKLDLYSMCAVAHGSPNIWLHERCYHYMQSWIDWQSLPRFIALPSSGEELSFAGELYEIANSRKQTRDSDTTLLPCVDYDGIEATLEQWQDRFAPARRGTKYLARALHEGLQGKDLFPALLKDFRAWMFMRPDIWPKPLEAIDTTATTVFTTLPINPISAIPLIDTLPNELLLLILRELPLPSLLALSSTCRSLRALITEPSFMDCVLKEAILRGSLKWILPVSSYKDEVQSCYESLRLWHPAVSESCQSDGDLIDESDLNALLVSPQLPRIAFVRACWESDSMMNRKRLWGLVKQFEAVWRSYRLHGWEVDRFYPSAEILDTLQIVQ
ncbi:hypothetical protein PHLCEN_2v8227 [Hermanssonia centrifuga]|uniref:F-box domain-containing protein n=1 Tax=Hermanssonia centrifuga TaxID=98765 RepID=A0A2R6NU88_9APHY|nr:hypothetical protein PHLCEN_2v8227 [Hermanssonia centrifuga]